MYKTRFFLNLIVILTLVFVALGTSPISAQAGKGNDELKADPRLLQMAAENPDATFMVIVQREVKNKNVQEDDPETDVERDGGKVKKQFKMVESFSAELTGKQILKLAAKKKVRWISVDAPMVSTATGTTVRDEFATAAYNNNNGTQTWAGNWIESGDGTSSATSGYVKISGGQLQMSSTNRTLSRQADLSGAVSATLSFQYKRSGLDSASDYVAIQISANGGSTWTELKRYAGSGSDSSWKTASFDILSYAAANTQIRFATSSSLGSSDILYVDNVQIEYALPAPVSTPSPTCNVSASGITTSASNKTVQFDITNNSESVLRIQKVTMIWPRGTNGDLKEVTFAGGQIFDTQWANSPVTIPDDVGWKSGTDSLRTINVSQTKTLRFLYDSNAANLGYDVIADFGGGCYVRVPVPTGTFAPSPFRSVVRADQLGGTLTGQGVTVAVIDSGISTFHPDFNTGGSSRIIANEKFGNNLTTEDLYGHGTHVAGIIGGNGSASGGNYKGMAPGVNLISLKTSNEIGMTYESDVVNAMQWVYDNKAAYNIRVVNISMNSTIAQSYHTSPLAAAAEILWFNGVVVVVSAGNNGTADGSSTIYPPANDPFVITVGATEDKGTVGLADDTMAVFSAYGVTEDGFAKPDLVAPGRNIVAPLGGLFNIIFQQHPLHRVDNYYFRMSGTSMSAPVVSGAVALLLQDEPNLTPDQVKYRLTASANADWAGYLPSQSGAGCLDAQAAVNASTTESANTGIMVSMMLTTGSDPVTWGSVGWNSVGWNSVGWNSVGWNSVGWNSVGWNSVGWNTSTWDD